MTKRELSQIQYLSKELKLLQERIEVIRSKAEKCTAVLSFGSKGSVKKDYKDDLIDLLETLEKKKQEYSGEQIRLENYITSVEDSFIRQIMILRYINCYSWVQVAFKMGGYNNDDSIRMSLNRYLKKQELAHK